MAVAYDATGTAETGVAFGAFTVPITAASGADVFAAIITDRDATVSGVECNGSTMTLIAQVGCDNQPGVVGSTYLYHSAAAGTGSSINVTGTVGTAYSQNSAVQAVSYTGVSSVGSSITNYGSSTSISSGSITLTTGQMAVCALGFGDYGQSATLSSPTGGTNRYNGSGSTGCAVAINDATSTATFGATLSSSGFWSTVGVVMSPPAGTLVTPTTATVTITGGTSSIVVGGNYVASPTTATVHVTGGTPVVVNGGPFAPLLALLAAGTSCNIQVLGDSTAAGYNGASNTGGWASDLGTILGTYYNMTTVSQTYGAGDPNEYADSTTLYSGSGGGTLTIFNAGIDGSTLANEETDITSSQLLAIQNNSYPNPAVVMIYDGYNDIGFTYGSQLSSSSWVSDVETYLTSYILNHYSGIPIIYCTQHTSFDGNLQTAFYADHSAVASMLTGNSLPLSPALQPSTNGTYPGVWVLDTQQAFNGYTSAEVMSSNLPHPSNTGYQIIADWMASVLAPSVTLSGGTVSPTTASVAILSGTPTVTVSGNYVAAPTTATVAITDGTPAVVLGTVAAPTTATVYITGGTPSLGGSFTASPTTATVTITDGTPQVLAPVVATPTTATVTITDGTSVITLLDLIVPTTATVHVTGGTSLITGYTYLAAPASASVHITGGTSVVAVASLILTTPAQRITHPPANVRTVQVVPKVRVVQVPDDA